MLCMDSGRGIAYRSFPCTGVSLTIVFIHCSKPTVCRDFLKNQTKNVVKKKRKGKNESLSKRFPVQVCSDANLVIAIQFLSQYICC